MFDDNGRHVGTKVTREQEWDDEQRGRMLSLLEYRRGICTCGFHRSVCRDKANGFTFEIDTCPVAAADEQFRRLMKERDKREEAAAGDNPHSLSSDGRTIHTRMLTDEEHAERRTKRQAAAATGTQPRQPTVRPRRPRP